MHPIEMQTARTALLLRLSMLQTRVLPSQCL